MKRSLNVSKSLSVAGMGTLGLLFLLLSSCLKESNPDLPPPTALVAVFQESPDQPPLDFYLNSNKVNQNPLNYGDGLDYFSAYAGQRTAVFSNAGAYSPFVVSAPVTLAPNAAYSLFMVNTVADPGIFLLTDTLVKPAPGFASIRFVDVSPDAQAVDLAVQGGSVLVANRSFEGYSSFMPIKGGAVYTFQILQTGTSNVVATLPSVTLNTGFVYTIIFKGLSAPTNSADNLNATLITNAYFY